MEKVKPRLPKMYNIWWLADDGDQVLLGSAISANPKDLLFNEVCRMIVMAPTYFKFDTEVNIRNIIQVGKGHREHYFATYGEQVISVIESEYTVSSSL